jgi:hypothetical protein
VLRDGPSFGGADGDMAAEGELPVEPDTEQAKRWLLAFFLSGGDRLDGQGIVHQDGRGGVVLLRCDVHCFQLFGGEGDLVVRAPFEHVSHVLGDQFSIVFKGVGGPL